MNPLLKDSTLPFEAVDFSSIKVEHFLPALDEAIKEAKLKLEEVKKETELSFDSI
jgi:peptidyl-dipeptidase Dcp